MGYAGALSTGQIPCDDWGRCGGLTLRRNADVTFQPKWGSAPYNGCCATFQEGHDAVVV